MKNLKLLTLFGVVLLAGTLAGCGTNGDVDSTDDTGNLVVEDVTGESDAVINYNDSLVELALNCIAYDNIMQSVYYDENSSVKSIQDAIDDAIDECSSAKKEIDKLGDWEGDSSLKDGTMNIIENYIAYYSKFSEIIPYTDKAQLTEEENNKYEQLLTEVENLSAQLDEANYNLVSIQEKFAADHGYLLEGDDVESSDMDTDAE